MRIHIVKSEDTWILRRIAHNIRIPGSTVGNSPDPRAALNFYVCYQGFKARVPGTRHVPWFTHFPAERDAGEKGFRRERWRRAVELADHCIGMSRETMTSLPPEKSSLWGGAPEPMFVKPTLVLGVAAKLSRRKCPERIEALKTIPGVEVRLTGGSLTLPELVEWYKGIDYLVVTSDTEGGPYPVMEAIAGGKPVIAPNVGWCWDYPVIRYEGTDGLLNVIRRLRFPPDPWGAASVELEDILRRVVNG